MSVPHGRKGLGKRCEGRVEPVEIKILPPGKSLDMCAEMREKGKLKKAPGEEGEGRRRRRRKRRLVETSGIEEVCYYSTVAIGNTQNTGQSS